jgi:hypothetical protein
MQGAMRVLSAQHSKRVFKLSEVTSCIAAEQRMQHAQQHSTAAGSNSGSAAVVPAPVQCHLHGLLLLSCKPFSTKNSIIHHCMHVLLLCLASMAVQ